MARTPINWQILLEDAVDSAKALQSHVVNLAIGGVGQPPSENDIKRIICELNKISAQVNSLIRSAGAVQKGEEDVIPELIDSTIPYKCRRCKYTRRNKNRTSVGIR